MKKTLAIVLALVMVLCMIPAMSATVTETKTISDKSYTLGVESFGNEVPFKVENNANSITFEYDYEKLKADTTGKFTEGATMGLVAIYGLDTAFTNKATITVDGKKLSVDAMADYASKSDMLKTASWGDNYVMFPVELTKAGYSDTYLVQVTETKDGKTLTETAKVSVKFVNTAEYKVAKDAYVTDVQSSNPKKLDAYIVGSKLYLDFVDKNAAGAADENLTITFADENRKAFTGITWAYNPKDGAIGVTTTATQTPKNFTTGYEGWTGWAVKLVDSAATYGMNINNIDGAKVTFKLETANSLYKTPEYTVVVRKGIAQADPKGIYFAETTKTIAMGETYAPVVMGVATGKPVAATIAVGDKTDKQVIDIVNNKVIGTREGVAYITASYDFITTDNVTKTYDSNSMKIVVTLPSESIPPVEPAATIYYVTCRNLNVRKGAGTSYAKAGMIHRGDAVKVVEIKGGWAKLADGTYVCAKYIAK